MYVEIVNGLSGAKLDAWKKFIEGAGILYDPLIEKTAILWDGEEIVASGSRYNNILKLIAVNPSRRGEDLTSAVIGALRNDAFKDGYSHLFLYTSPKNQPVFSSLFFYPVAATDKVVLLENKRGGVTDFINALPRKSSCNKVGSVVMNCNPFTLGHKYLIELAARECDLLYVFVLSEDKSEFSSEDRMEMVKVGVAHLNNVIVAPTGPYLISSATFPTYFLKERDSITDVQCLLDVEIFVRHFAKNLDIKYRYVGSEPSSKLTLAYNETLKRHLPEMGVTVKEVKRLENDGRPISASTARALIKEGRRDGLSALLPETTTNFLLKKGYI